MLAFFNVVSSHMHKKSKLNAKYTYLIEKNSALSRTSFMKYFLFLEETFFKHLLNLIIFYFSPEPQSSLEIVRIPLMDFSAQAQSSGSTFSSLFL
jgi:hypothetical protein